MEVIDSVLLNEFQDFMKLPENLIRSVMKCCDFKSRLQLSETCTLLNRLLFTSPKLMRHIQLNINTYCGYKIKTILDKLSTILRSGRKYQKVQLNYGLDGMKATPKYLKALNVVGKYVKKLTLDHGDFNNNDLMKLLKCFENIEKLKVDSIYVSKHASNTVATWNFEATQFMPKLKEISLSSSSFRFLNVLMGVKNLEKIDIPYDWLDESLVFENFISQQDKLKHLAIVGKSFDQLTFESCLHRIKFQLETFVFRAMYCSDPDKPFLCIHSNFFKNQQNLKSVEIENSSYGGATCDDWNEFYATMSSIFSLPKLEFLQLKGEIFGVNDFSLMSNIENYSVKKMRCSYEGEILEVLKNFFPKASYGNCLEET
jgi:F-box domain